MFTYCYSFFTDPTISTLTSGTPSQNVDLAGLSFPRRLGFKLRSDFAEHYHLVGLQCFWEAFEDDMFTKSLGKDFTHQGIIDRTVWCKYYFKGIFPKDYAYLKCEIRNPQTRQLVRTFYFKFTKSYQTSLDGRTYVKDPILQQKVVKNGLLTELRPFKNADGKIVKYKPGHVGFKVDKMADLMGAAHKETTKVNVIEQYLLRYSEKPKIVFLVTPPHLMKYAKLLLILITQLVNLNFEQSYMTKESQKPFILVAMTKMVVMWMITNKFITKAQARYGDKFDYSRVDYVNSYTPVTILCPTHGEFQVRPNSFLHYKYGCPKCGYSEAGKKRSGENSVAHRADVKRKKRQTCLEKYGAKTWAESDAGRRKLHNLYYENNIGDKLEKTCLEKYGVRRASQTDAAKEKMRLTCLHKYGVDSVSKVPSLRDKYEETCLFKYGVRCPLSSKSIIDKVITAKAKNHTFNTSKPEEELYALLCDTFGSDDVIRQYKETRYPYSCDFYIKPFDIFIELNIHWTHGYTPYDATNEQHQERLKQLVQLSKDSSYYEQAIDVWTKRDVEKRQCAKDNKLNYVVFWDNDLADAKAWLLNWKLYH